MDNMLYIIAGLVLILLVAALFLRKNKAQKSSARLPANSREGLMASASTVDYGTSTQTDVSNSHKFDHVTIAQRFIDQQRYDKAIETIKRGLSEKPNDSTLSLKLLSIYGTTNQPQDFDHVYDSLKAHSDEHTITRADELKHLYFEEQNSVVTQEMPVEDTANFGGIDFDLPSSQAPTSTQASTSTQTNNVTSEYPVAADHSTAVINEPVESSVTSNKPNETELSIEEDSFELTLDDLENNFHEAEVTNETSDVSSDITNDYVLETPINDSVDNNEDNDLIDFEFDFGSFDTDDSTEGSAATNVLHDESEEDESAKIALEDNEDFILDFDDLAADTDKPDVITDNISNDIEKNTAITIESDEDDFALTLDDLDTSNDTSPAFNHEISSTEESHDMDNFTLENIEFENTTSESIALQEDSFADTTLEEQLLDENIEINNIEESNVSPAAPLRFDDNSIIDDGFDIDGLDIDDSNSIFETPSTITTAAPVESENSISLQENESTEDFSSRFAADFDFVKSLDSNQVTLDLADQYLQLGEYDSAKRLLNEVIIQGNSEQKQQAQQLLERTA